MLGTTFLYSPLFEEEVDEQTIPDGYELIGASVTIFGGKFWPNFLLWPTAQRIL